MKTKTLLAGFLLSVMTFCMSACLDDAEMFFHKRTGSLYLLYIRVVLESDRQNK